MTRHERYYHPTLKPKVLHTYFSDVTANKGWEAGVDGNVALITVGAGQSATSFNTKEPIVGFVFDVKGLMGDISLKGAKFSKIDKKE
jgi:lipid-binding SYLF domain-containing protein